jgi:hypothetical protein
VAFGKRCRVFVSCRYDRKHVRIEQNSKKKTDPKENKNDERWSKEQRAKPIDVLVVNGG